MSNAPNENLPASYTITIDEFDMNPKQKSIAEILPQNVDLIFEAAQEKIEREKSAFSKN